MAPNQTLSPKIYTVSELNHLAQNLLEGHFSNIWVEGEISNLKRVASSGHCYFSLKDESAQVQIAAFRGVMSTIRFKLEDGLKVLVSGRVTLYLQRGQFQIKASSVEPRGLGALQLAFEQLKKKLEAEGLFDPARKRPIPVFPQRIGIVTSPTGAAIQDILTVINRRFASVEILIYPAKVQGEGAKDEIAEGIEYLNENHPRLDVLLVGRGGGSVEDLWAFNEEIVARAVSSSKIPVISCVGHEIDFTITDFVADLRAPTPSAAAEIVVRDKSELRSALSGILSRLQQNLLSTVNFCLERLKGVSRSPVFAKPERLFEERVQTLDDLMEKSVRAFEKMIEIGRNQVTLLSSKIALLSPQSVLGERQKFLSIQMDRMGQAMGRDLEVLRDDLRVSAGRLEALSPLAVLSRGYAIVWSLPDYKILKSSLQVSAQDSIRVKLHQGEIRATVKETKCHSIGEESHDEERDQRVERR